MFGRRFAPRTLHNNHCNFARRSCKQLNCMNSEIDPRSTVKQRQPIWPRAKSVSDDARACTHGVLLTLLCSLPIFAAAQTPMTLALLDQFDAQKTTVDLSNGERLAYIDLGWRDGPPLVLIHGYTDSARDWAPIAPLLTPHFRLIIVDFLGHAASLNPHSSYPRFLFPSPIKLLLDTLHLGP